MNRTDRATAFWLGLVVGLLGLVVANVSAIHSSKWEARALIIGGIILMCIALRSEYNQRKNF